MFKIPLSIPNLSGNEAKYLQECVESNFISSAGKFVGQLEDMVAQSSSCPHVVATSSGTSALHTALVTLGVRRDDLVIMPSLTFIASANAIKHAEADPWIFDVDVQSWALDPVLLAEELASKTEMVGEKCVHKATGRRVSAIMPVYLMGFVCDMGPILEIAQQYNLFVVADAAAALGATYKGKKVADLGADATAFSFNGNKTVTAGGGGAVAFKDADKAEHAKMLTTTARIGPGYDHEFVAYNYRMTNIEAAIACAQMEQLDAFVERKRSIHAFYQSAFSDLDALEPFPEPEWTQSACWFSGVFCDEGQGETYIQGLLDAEIEARPFWKPIHLQKPYKDAPVTTQKNTETIWKRVITLPCSTSITEEELQAVADVVKQVHGGLHG